MNTEQHGSFRSQPVSFVRRGSRLQGRRQQAWDEHAAALVLDVPRGAAETSVHPDYVLDPEAAFSRRAPLVVEIGSGLGDAVVHAAEQQPEWNFLAVEVYLPGLAQTLLRVGQRGLSNVRVVQANAPEVLNSLPARSVHEVWVFFPDPWHKARHTKRRLVKDGFAPEVARVLEPGGLWRLATDWADYAAQMRDVVTAAEEFENLHSGERATPEDPTGGYAPRFAGRIATSFENKAHRAGRNIYDLTFRRRQVAGQ